MVRSRNAHYDANSDSPAGQIQRRLEILRAWKSAGAVPADKVSTFPRNLEDARRWNDSDLGIKEIGSNSDFVAKNDPKVDLIRVCIKDLRKLIRAAQNRENTDKFEKPKHRRVNKSEETRRKEVDAENTHLKNRNTALLGQYQAVEYKCESLSRELTSARSRIAQLESEKKLLNARIAALTAQLHSVTGLRSAT